MCIVTMEKHLKEQNLEFSVMALLRISKILVLIIVCLLIPIIARIIFYCQVKELLMILMIVLVLQKKSLLLTLIKQRIKFCSSFLYNCDNSLENIYLSLKSLIKYPFSYSIFFQEAHLNILNQKKYRISR